jgi:DDB1- and CUL4-associated factor 15
MIKKRLTATSDEESDNGESLRGRPAKTRRKRVNKQILTRIINRSSTGYFSSSLNHKFHQKTFGSDHVLKFCLKDIIPFRYLNDHIFMGLSSCGNFLISYKRVCCDNEASMNFNENYKYELFFWIYRPHFPLSRYVRKIDFIGPVSFNGSIFYFSTP